MPDYTTTTNYGYLKPNVSGDTGAWGGDLNTSLNAIDAQDKVLEVAAAAAQTTANAALPKAGGVMTGKVDLYSERYGIVALGSTLTFALDLSLGMVYTASHAGGSGTVSFTNVPAGSGFAASVLFKLTNGGIGAVTWPGTVRWHSGTAPSLTVSGVDLIAFITFDAGTSWFATYVLDVR